MIYNKGCSMEEVSGKVEMMATNKNELKELDFRFERKTSKVSIRWDCGSDVCTLNGMLPKSE